MDPGTATHLLTATPHHHIGQAVRDWTLAASALIAAVGAAAAAVIAALAYRQQAADRHREHASKFSVWGEIVYDGDDVEAQRINPRRRAVAHVRNSSDEPMYRVVVVFRDGHDPNRTLATGDPVIDVLPPRETRQVYGNRVNTTTAGFAGVHAEGGFSDRADCRWYRDWRGHLREQPEHIGPTDQEQ